MVESVTVEATFCFPDSRQPFNGEALYGILRFGRNQFSGRPCGDEIQPPSSWLRLHTFYFKSAPSLAKVRGRRLWNLF